MGSAQSIHGPDPASCSDLVYRSMGPHLAVWMGAGGSPALIKLGEGDGRKVGVARPISSCTGRGRGVWPSSLCRGRVHGNLTAGQWPLLPYCQIF